MKEVVLPFYFHTGVENSQRLSPDRTKLVVKGVERSTVTKTVSTYMNSVSPQMIDRTVTMEDVKFNVSVVFLHDDISPELKTVLFDYRSVGLPRWVSDFELLVVEERGDKPGAFVLNIRNLEQKMVVDVPVRSMVFSDKWKLAAFIFGRKPIKVKVFDFEQHQYIAEFDVPFQSLGTQGAWLDEGKTLVLYNNLVPGKLFHCKPDSGIMSEVNFDFPSEDYRIREIYDKYWIVAKNPQGQRTTYYLYDAAEDSYTKLGTYMQNMIVLAERYLVAEQ